MAFCRTATSTQQGSHQGFFCENDYRSRDFGPKKAFVDVFRCFCGPARRFQYVFAATKLLVMF